MEETGLCGHNCDVYVDLLSVITAGVLIQRKMNAERD